MRGLCNIYAEPFLPFSFCPWSTLNKDVSSNDYVVMLSIGVNMDTMKYTKNIVETSRSF